MSPANLTDAPASAQPCGCDDAAGWTCTNHKVIRAAEQLIRGWKLDLDLLTKAAAGTNDPLTEAKLIVEAERIAISIVQLEDILYA